MRGASSQYPTVKRSRMCAGWSSSSIMATAKSSSEVGAGRRTWRPDIRAEVMVVATRGEKQCAWIVARRGVEANTALVVFANRLCTGRL